MRIQPRHVPWLFLLVATPLCTAAGYFAKLPLLLPLLQILPAYPLLVLDLRERRLASAILKMLCWAFLMAGTVEVLALYAPAAGEASVLHGAAYRNEMIAWVRTGVGKESSWRQFLPEHAVHLSLFVILSLASAGLLSLLLGAGLMNYMSFYVGSLLGIARAPGRVLLAGWPPWAILRVASFVILGVVLAGPGLQRLGVAPFEWEGKRRWILLAAAGLLLDVLLKIALAARWSVLLRSALYPLGGGF